MKQLALYIHWPFCESKCPYCDFNSHVEQFDQNLWLESYIKALKMHQIYLQDKHITSIFFGGGTPSLMDPEISKTIISFIKDNSYTDNNLEITVEANPSSYEAKKFEAFQKSGINRISIGVQSLNQENLLFLGRKHDASSATYAIKHAKEQFENFSFDLIYALPKQNLNLWLDELSQAIDFQAKHMSLYQLTIEKGTQFYKDYLSKQLVPMNEDLTIQFYEETQKQMHNAGYKSYEISNFAKEGYECRHNMSYWHYNQYLGIGPGAHSRIHEGDKVFALVEEHHPKKWQSLIDKEDGSQYQQKLNLTKQEILEEFLIMNLRLDRGFKISKFEDFFKAKVSDLLNVKEIVKLKENQYLYYDSDEFYLTNKGKLIMNHIISKICGLQENNK